MPDCKVLYDYQSTNPQSELSIQKNEILAIEKSTGDWWLCRNNRGESGYIPSNYVEVIQESPQQQSSSNSYNHNNSGQGTLEQCVAEHDFTANRQDELSFKKGQIIDVLEKSGDGWWMGKSEGRDGWFPANFVKVMSKSQTSTSPNMSSITSQLNNMFTKEQKSVPKQNLTSNNQSSSNPKCLHQARAMYQFDGQDGELSLLPDQIVEIIEKPATTPDWWVARDTISQRTGLIPSNYIELIAESDKPRANNALAAGDNFMPPGSNLNGKPYFKGQLSRAQAEQNLNYCQIGQFLVRNAESQPQGDQYSISVKADRRIRHFRVSFTLGKFQIGTKTFPSMDHLIEHYQRLPIFADKATGEKLTLSTNA